MRKPFESILILILIASFFYSCKSPCSTKNIECRAFDSTSFIQWFPYDQGDTLVFKDPDGKTTTIFSIREKYFSEQYTTTIGFYSSGSGDCRSNASVHSDSLTIYYDVYQLQDDSPPSHGLSIILNKTSFNLGELTSSSIATGSSDFISLETMNNFQFAPGGKMYPLVITAKFIDEANASEGKPYKIYIAKNYGLVGYEIYGTNQVFIKQ